MVKIGPVVDGWPPRSVTVMLVLPSGRSGMRTTCVSGEVARTVAGVASNVTASSKRKRAPLIVTDFPDEPTSGSTPVITGDGPAALGGGNGWGGAGAAAAA